MSCNGKRSAFNSGIISGVNLDDVQIDKTSISVFTRFEEADEVDRSYWRNASYAERLMAIELMRQSAYGYGDSSTPRLRRILEIVRGE